MNVDSDNEASDDDLIIRDLDPAVEERLRVSAAQKGHSMEEARRILTKTLEAESTSSE